MLDEYQLELATRCLWSLQEAVLEVEGLLLSHVDGLTLTSTLEGDESTERFAAIATTMFLLGEEMSESWGKGESSELFIKFTHANEESRYIYMQPIGIRAVLVVICRVPDLSARLRRDLQTAVNYLEAVINDEAPPALLWSQ